MKFVKFLKKFVITEEFYKKLFCVAKDHQTTLLYLWVHSVSFNPCSLLNKTYFWCFLNTNFFTRYSVITCIKQNPRKDTSEHLRRNNFVIAHARHSEHLKHTVKSQRFQDTFILYIIWIINNEAFWYMNHQILGIQITELPRPHCMNCSVFQSSVLLCFTVVYIQCAWLYLYNNSYITLLSTSTGIEDTKFYNH